MFYAVSKVIRRAEVIGYYIYEWGTRRSTFWEMGRIAEFCSSLEGYAIQNMEYTDGKFVPLWQDEDSLPKLFVSEDWHITDTSKGAVVLGFELGSNSYMNYKYPDSWVTTCLVGSKIKRLTSNEVIMYGIKEAQRVFIGEKPINATVAFRKNKLTKDNTYEANGALISETLNNLGVAEVCVKGVTDTTGSIALLQYIHLLVKLTVQEEVNLNRTELGGFIRFIGSKALKGFRTDVLSITGDCTKYELQSVLQATARVIDLSSSSGMLTDIRFETSFNYGSVEELILPSTIEGMPNSVDENNSIKKLWLGKLRPGHVTVDMLNFKALEVIYVKSEGYDLELLKSVICAQFGREIKVFTRKDVDKCSTGNYSWY